MKFSTLISVVALTAGVSAESSSSSASYKSRTFSTVEPSASEISLQASNATTGHQTSSVQGKAFDRFVVIWLENTDYDKAADDSNMAKLAEQGIILTNYWALTHPSEPNYLASVGGDYFSLDDDRFISMPENVSSIVDLLDNDGISWATYQEHMPYSGFQGFNYSNQETFANDYVRKHHPLVLYDSITKNSSRLSNLKNFTEFDNDLKNEKLPQFMIITPNMTNDGHDTTIKYAANWCKEFITPLLSNEYFMNNTLVLLTFDENDSYSIKNKVYSILLGGVIPDELKGTTDNTYYDHYSQISSIEANWDLYHLGRNDIDANVFETVANATNITNVDVDTTFKVNNETYVGYLDDVNIDLPAPNVSATNMNGKGILPAISSVWASQYEKEISASYYTSTTTTISASLTDAVTLTSAVSNSTKTESDSESASASASASASKSVSQSTTKENSTSGTESSSSKAGAATLGVNILSSLFVLAANLIL